MFRFRNFQLFQKRNFNFDTYKKVYNDLKGIHPKYQKYLKFGFDFVVAVAVVNIVAWSIGSPSICLGPSMLPTINVEGDAVLIDGYLFGPPFKPYRRGDIVISRSKVDPTKNVCKRIAALPGDIVVSLNDDPFTRHIIKDIIDTNSTLPPRELAKLISTRLPQAVITKIEPNNIWLAGDNPNNSFDSRNYGPAKIDDILGRVTLKLVEQYYKSFFKVIKTENFGRSEHSALIIVYSRY